MAGAKFYIVFIDLEKVGDVYTPRKVIWRALKKMQ